MNSIWQALVIFRLSARSFRQRIKSSLVVVVGLVCVAVGLLSILSLGEGIKWSLLDSGHPARVLILSADSTDAWVGDWERKSRVPSLMIENIRNSADVARSKDGAVLADLQSYATINPFKKANHEKGGVRLRGIGPAGMAILSELRLVQGRVYRPGTREIIVGTTAQAKFSGMEVGDTITTPLGQWRVVGAFTTATQLDGDIVGDAAAVKGALAQENYNFALVRLQTPDALGSFRASLARLNRIPVSVVRESDYYERYWKAIPNTPYVVAYLLGGLLALGAIAGTLHTMTVAVDARTREIALLRAAGFERVPIAASVVLEAMLLAALGAIIGTAIDWFWLNGYVYNAQGVFRVIVTPKLLMVSLGWALAIALIGALTPALGAAKGTVADALRK